MTQVALSKKLWKLFDVDPEAKIVIDKDGVTVESEIVRSMEDLR